MSKSNDRVIAVRTNKTVYRRENTVAKVFDEDFSKTDILNEALNQARVEEIGLKIPKVLEVTKTNGKWTIISEFIPGKTLQQLMEEAPQKAGEYLDRFVRLQTEMHGKRCPMLGRLAEKLRGRISVSAFSAATRYDLLTRLDGLEAGSAVCHGDFNPSNVIVTPDGADYVIDWAHVTQGSASADAARTYLLFWMDGKIDMAEAYLDLYCARSGTAKSGVQKWIPIIAASRSVNCRPEEVEFLKHWVDVVDYE
jgi:tRNA A-37 threonylcarbamoyl transferase component Bud32